VFIPIAIFLILICGAFSGCVSDESQWEVKIKYPGNWSGAVGGINSASYDGYGDRTITVNGDIVSAVIQKQEGGSYLLCVEIWRVGGSGYEERSCTNAEYGVVTVGAINNGGLTYSGWYANSILIFIIIFGISMYFVSLSITRSHNSNYRQEAHVTNRNVPIYQSKPTMSGMSQRERSKELARIRHSSYRGGVSRTNSTKSQPKGPPPLLQPPSNSPPVYTKPSFQVDGFDWLDFNGEKWRRPTRRIERFWELYIEESASEGGDEDMLQTIWNKEGNKRCAAVISYSLGLRCKNWFDGEGRYCIEHTKLKDDVFNDL